MGYELLFKKMKQTFPLHYFFGENVNAGLVYPYSTAAADGNTENKPGKKGFLRCCIIGSHSLNPLA